MPSQNINSYYFPNTFINFTYEQENSGDLVHKRAVRARLEEYFERKRLKDEEDEFDWNNTKF